MPRHIDPEAARSAAAWGGRCYAYLSAARIADAAGHRYVADKTAELAAQCATYAGTCARLSGLLTDAPDGAEE